MHQKKVLNFSSQGFGTPCLQSHCQPASKCNNTFHKLSSHLLHRLHFYYPFTFYLFINICLLCLYRVIQLYISIKLVSCSFLCSSEIQEETTLSTIPLGLEVNRGSTLKTATSSYIARIPEPVESLEIAVLKLYL